MAALLTSMMVFHAGGPFHQAAALVQLNTATLIQWVGEHTVHELFDNDTIDQLLKDGLMKTRQNPDYPDRTQYFVVKAPADAEFMLPACPQKHDDEDAEVQNHEEATAQNLGKEWIGTEKLQKEYGDDKVEELVKSGRLEKRQNPDSPKQTQLGKEWISTKELLEKFDIDTVEELLTSGRVEKRQNPSCPERTQYYVKEEPLSSAPTEEEVQKPEEVQVQEHDEPKMEKHGKAKTHEGTLRKRGNKEANVQKHKEATVQKHDQAKVQKHGKVKTHEGKVQKHDDEEADVQKHEESKVQKQHEAKMHKHGKAKDADIVSSSEGEEKSAATPARVLTAVVAIIAAAFFA